MSVKLKYISKRLLICAVAVELLLILMAGYIWLASLERSAGLILAAFFTLAVVLVNLLAFRLVVIVKNRRLMGAGPETIGKQK